MKWILILICFAALLGIYVCIENNLLIVRRYSLESDGGGDSLKIVQVSDVHKKRCGKRIVSMIKSLSPDVIFLTGDIVSRSEKDYSQLELLASELTKICPVYGCPGNHELDLADEKYSEYKKILKKNGVFWLENEQIQFEKNGCKINVAGAALKREIYKNDKGGYSGLETLTAKGLEKSLGKKNGFTVLLAHNPLCADAYKEWGADVVFSGHVHGGAVRLPFIGGVLSPERRFFPGYSKGVYDLGGTRMVVSGGIGKLRVFNPPEIVVCDIALNLICNP